MELVDNHMRDEIGEKMVRNVINLGLWCLKDSSLIAGMTRKNSYGGITKHI